MDLFADLAAFGGLLAAEWQNGHLDEKAYLRLNADLTGIVAKYRTLLPDADDYESIRLMLHEFPTWFPELEAKIAPFSKSHLQK